MVSVHASPLADVGAGAGSQSVHVANLAAALVRHGCEVTVYTRRDRPDVEAAVETPDGYAVVHVDAGPAEPMPRDDLLPYATRFAERLGESWGVERPDVVHAHHWLSGLAALRVALPFELPVVQTFHGLGSIQGRHLGAADPSPRERPGVEREIGTRSEAVIATCEDEAAELIAAGVPDEKIAVVPGGVDLDRFCPVGTVGAGVAGGRNGRSRLVAAGKLVRRKGFDLAVASLLHLPATELVIAGGSAEHSGDAEPSRLRWVAQECGVADRLILPGAVAHDAMPALYRASEVAVCTAWYEPLGTVALEAMACGVPVVGTAVGALGDIVDDGVTGALVRSHDPAAFAAAVRPFLEDDNLRLRAGLAARSRACAGHSWEAVAAATLKTYDQALR